MDYNRTNLEEILANTLRYRGIEFVEQHPTRSGFVLDFVISPNIVIEVDGPCHDGSRNRKKDRFRDRILKAEGWKIYRVSYKVISDPEKFASKLDEILSPL